MSLSKSAFRLPHATKCIEIDVIEDTAQAPVGRLSLSVRGVQRVSNGNALGEAWACPPPFNHQF